MKALLSAFCLIVGTLTSFAETIDEVREILQGPWTEVSISAVHTCTCDGPFYFGFRLKRDDEGITIASLKGNCREVSVGRENNLSQTELDAIVAATIKQYESAIATKSEHELLNERLEKITGGDDRLIETALTCKTKDMDRIGISIAFGTRLTQPQYENDFDKVAGSEFATWTSLQAKRGTPKKQR